jgi:hypothetical protein
MVRLLITLPQQQQLFLRPTHHHTAVATETHPSPYAGKAFEFLVELEHYPGRCPRRVHVQGNAAGQAALFHHNVSPTPGRSRDSPPVPGLWFEVDLHSTHIRRRWGPPTLLAMGPASLAAMLYEVMQSPQELTSLNAEAWLLVHSEGPGQDPQQNIPEFLRRAKEACASLPGCACPARTQAQQATG